MKKDTLHLYKRVSTDQQEIEGHSLEYQEDLGIKKSQELGMDYKIHNEGSKSGSGDDLDGRPVLSNLMTMVRGGEVKHIFVYEFSRLSRNPVISSIITEDFRKHGVKVHLTNGDYDLSSPIDEMVSTILNSVSRYERQTIIIRSKLGLRKSYEKGKITGQIPPLGYKKDEKGYLVVDKEEKETYLMILGWGLNGISSGEISRRLNDLGIPTKYSKYRPNGVKWKNKDGEVVKEKKGDEFWWKQQTILSIIKNPTYYGFRRYKGDLIPHSHPIIDEDTWKRLQEKQKEMVNKSRNRKGGRQKHFYLLKGFLRCGKCGSNLNGRRKTNENTYFCGKKRKENRDKPTDPPCELRSPNIEVLDNLVWETLVNTLSNSHLRREEVKNRILGEKGNDERVTSYTNKINSLNRDLEDLNNQSKRLLRLFTSGRIDESGFDSENNIIQSKNNNLHKEVEGIQTQLNLIDNPEKWVSWLDEFDKEVEGVVNLTDGVEKRKVLWKYVDEIVVDSGDGNHNISINLTYPIVNDKLIYNDKKKKNEGYKIKEGNKSVIVETETPSKKNSLKPPHKALYHRRPCGVAL
jgi:DNA invertase Pin-like site-specific DNA recombinase